ncbi:MAG: PASTA domain-containing protein [Ruminococcus sp.]|nr:PASTA domain-containing protein [Ruminococcus sp.]
MDERKLKAAAEKITMPDQLKDRILDQCENSSGEKNGEYIEVSGVERVERRPVRRAIAAAAAFAVCAGGIGLSAHLISRNGAPADEISESSEEIEPTETVTTPEASHKKWDFVNNRYEITYTEKDTVLEPSDQITAFLNCFDWGEEKDSDIYSGYYTAFQQVAHIELRDEEREPVYFNISHTVATPPESGESGIVLVTSREYEDKDWSDGYYAIDLDELAVFLDDEMQRQEFGMKNLWHDLAGAYFTVYGGGMSVEADKMELARIGEAIDALEFAPLNEIPQEAEEESGEAWHFMLDPSELVIFPSGTAIYHKNERNTDNSLTNIYNTYYKVNFDEINAVLPPFTETNDQREALMPDLVGMTEGLAEEQLRQMGLSFEKAYVETDQYQPGYVAETKPTPGEPVTDGDTVMIYIAMSNGSATVDNYLGMTEDDAVTEANYSGLKVDVEYANGYSVQGTVIGQSKAAGVIIGTGSEITLTVSTGEPPLEGYPPFGTLCKMGCFINGSEFSDGDKTLCLVSDILSRYDWSNEETDTGLFKEAATNYVVDALVNDAHRIVYIYADGTVEWIETQDLAANDLKVYRYRDIDGEVDDLLFQLHQALDDLMPYAQYGE